MNHPNYALYGLLNVFEIDLGHISKIFITLAKVTVVCLI